MTLIPSTYCPPCRRAAKLPGRHRKHSCSGDPLGFAAGAPCTCPGHPYSVDPDVLTALRERS